VFRVARGEIAVQDKHFKLFTVVETRKMAEIRNFQNFDVNLQKKVKKVEYLGNG